MLSDCLRTFYLTLETKVLIFVFFILPRSLILRHQDLQLYLPQLQHYRDTSDLLSKWIDDTKRKQENLRSTKIKNVETLKDHINKQKVFFVVVLSNLSLTCH